MDVCTSTSTHVQSILLHALKQTPVCIPVVTHKEPFVKRQSARVCVRVCTHCFQSFISGRHRKENVVYAEGCEGETDSGRRWRLSGQRQIPNACSFTVMIFIHYIILHSPKRITTFKSTMIVIQNQVHATYCMNILIFALSELVVCRITHTQTHTRTGTHTLAPHSVSKWKWNVPWILQNYEAIHKADHK